MDNNLFKVGTNLLVKELLDNNLKD
jgi:hypothetical protein